MTTPDTITDGRNVIERGPAYFNTNAVGRILSEPKLAKGISEVLLADDTIVYECDERDYFHADIMNVVRHMGKHTHAANKYPVDVVEKVLRYFDRERAKGIRGAAERTAMRLNKDKVPTPSGVRWLAATVSSLAQRHKLEDTPAPAEPKPLAALMDVMRKGMDPPAAHDPFKALEGVTLGDPGPIPPALALAMTAPRTIEEVAALISGWLDVMVDMAEKACPHSDYDAIKAKADAFDQMRTFMGKGIGEV